MADGGIGFNKRREGPGGGGRKPAVVLGARLFQVGKGV